MEDKNEVAQQTVRVEGCLLVEMIVSKVTAIDVVLRESTETSVRLVVRGHLSIGEGARAVVFKEPTVGVVSAIEHRIEGKGCAAAAW